MWSTIRQKLKRIYRRIFPRRLSRHEIIKYECENMKLLVTVEHIVFALLACIIYILSIVGLRCLF